jgi:hypothetical protein
MGGRAVTRSVTFPVGGQTPNPTTAIVGSLSILDSHGFGFKKQRGSMPLLSGDNGASGTQEKDPGE